MRHQAPFFGRVGHCRGSRIAALVGAVGVVMAGWTHPARAEEKAPSVSAPSTMASADATAKTATKADDGKSTADAPNPILKISSSEVDAHAREHADEAVTKLSPMIVRGANTPTAQQVGGVETEAVNKYLGEPGTVSRALNAVTIAEVWKKVPLLGRWSDWADDPKKRAVDAYFDEKMRKLRLGLVDFTGETGKVRWLNPKDSGVSP